MQAFERVFPGAKQDRGGGGRVSQKINKYVPSVYSPARMHCV